MAITLLFTRAEMDQVNRSTACLEKVCANCAPYALGDFVRYNGQGHRKAEEKCYPGSIGHHYGLLTQENDRNNFTALSVASEAVCPRYYSKFMGREAVVHVRTGDVLCRTSHNSSLILLRRPAQATEFARILRHYLGHQHMTLLTGNHRGLCIKESERFMMQLRKELSNVSQPLGNADEHFCMMVFAKVFVQGKGGFSQVAGKVREVKNSTTIYDARLADFGEYE
jgi:hypothetical protein